MYPHNNPWGRDAIIPVLQVRRLRSRKTCQNHTPACVRARIWTHVIWVWYQSESASAPCYIPHTSVFGSCSHAVLVLGALTFQDSESEWGSVSTYSVQDWEQNKVKSLFKWKNFSFSSFIPFSPLDNFLVSLPFVFLFCHSYWLNIGFLASVLYVSFLSSQSFHVLVFLSLFWEFSFALSFGHSLEFEDHMFIYLISTNSFLVSEFLSKSF